MKSLVTILLVSLCLTTQAQDLDLASSRAKTGTYVMVSGLTFALMGVATGQTSLMKPMGMLGGLAILAGVVIQTSAWWHVGNLSVGIKGNGIGLRLQI